MATYEEHACAATARRTCLSSTTDGLSLPRGAWRLNVRLQTCTGLFRSALRNLESFENMLVPAQPHREGRRPVRPARAAANHDHRFLRRHEFRACRAGDPAAQGRADSPRHRRRSAARPVSVRQWQEISRTATAPERFARGRSSSCLTLRSAVDLMYKRRLDVLGPSYERIMPGLAFVLTVFPWWCCSPYKMPEAAYAMLVPGIF